MGLVGVRDLMALIEGSRLASSTVQPALIFPMGGVFTKYSVQAVAWLFSKKSELFFGISRFKKIDTVT